MKDELLKNINSLGDLPHWVAPKMQKGEAMMLVTMNKNMSAVNDGDVQPTDFIKGETYEVGEDLGNVLLDNKWAKIAKGPVKVEDELPAAQIDLFSGDEEVDTKMLKVPENK